MTRRRTPDDVRESIKEDLARHAEAKQYTLEAIATRHGVSRALVVLVQREINGKIEWTKR